MFEYETFQQTANELAHRAEHERLVREAKQAQRLRRRTVAARFTRRVAKRVH
ncbi:hypothetical protein ACIBCA_20770 [Kitasatospora sp. NPDC051170]|uniref:hypothetical protein n=1 Tax=Kitasatospora sp. NPDC051170 TaxID=3364056 RepID=UPI0037906844